MTPCASSQGDDSFTLDVSNGFTTVEDLQVTVSVVPRFIPLQSSNLTVKEGLGRAVDATVLNITHPFYSSANIEFIVEEAPQHGDIRYHDGDDLTYFTWEEVWRESEQTHWLIGSKPWLKLIGYRVLEEGSLILKLVTGCTEIH